MRRETSLVTSLTYTTVKNPRGGRGESTAEAAMRYFSQLDKKTIRDLYEVYKVDFEMFLYDREGYY